MKLTTTRRISQIFFFLIFLWFCIVTTLGSEWWQLRGWAVNWFLQLDPLTGITTILTTHTLYAGLLWGLVTVVLTILLGRFFCGWVCPFGALHHFISFLANQNQSSRQKIAKNRYHPLQSFKYCFLIFFLIAAIATPSIQTGLLDPMPLLYRSVNLVLLPILQDATLRLSPIQRYYEDVWSVGIIFLIALIMNLFIPRFYCRFICPLGALFGIMSRFSLWRIGSRKYFQAPESSQNKGCSNCHLCERHCEGACKPSQQFRISECVLCMNCLHECPHDLITYSTNPSASGEIVSPDISRREFVVSCLSGATAIPMLRLSGYTGANHNPNLIRPPGALPEKEFLARCVKCGQCMRICPTNVIQPSGIAGGLESLWTPALNFRIGTSGCQRNCIACGHLCPTGAIRPLSLDERLGISKYKVSGPVKIGTAFVDQSRCLPWSMEKPCIVCQENCPVSPKAILTYEHFSTVKTIQGLKLNHLVVRKSKRFDITLESEILDPGHFSTGDYFCRIEGEEPLLILNNTTNRLTISPKHKGEQMPLPGTSVMIQIRLQRPYIDLNRCIGCGVCEHECPVRGKRAIRVTSEREISLFSRGI